MPIGSILVSPSGDAQATDTDLDGLVASIRARGVLHPLVVAPDGRLLAGRRRLEAARRAGLTTVPVRVCEVDTERTAIEIGLIENVERVDLDPLTRAKSYRALIEQGTAVEEIAKQVRPGVSHVYQHLQLLDLHPQVQQALHARAISFADARMLAPLELADQAAVLQEIRASPKPLSSRQVKARVEARRVMQWVKQANESARQLPDEPNLDGYTALFETAEDKAAKGTSQVLVANPLDELNALIAEMIAAAQGEDQIRAWARRLARILEALGADDAAGKKESASAVQDRLL